MMDIHDVTNADANVLVWSDYSEQFLKNDMAELFDSTNVPTNTDGEIHNHQAITTYAKDKITDYTNRKLWFFWVQGR
jgi:hypothetical protein